MSAVKKLLLPPPGAKPPPAVFPPAPAKPPPAKKKERKKEKVGDAIVTNGRVYKIMSVLGSGGFGDVYKVRQTKIGDRFLTEVKEFAMKTERYDFVDESKRRLQVERIVYTSLKEGKGDEPGRNHFAKMHEFGMTPDFNYLVMDMVGESLVDLRKKMPDKQNSPRTIAEIASQTLVALETLHGIGYVHLDIKPHNFAIGVSPRESTIFMLDFGMAREYREPDGRVRPARPRVRWAGTIRYASARGLCGEEQGRRDDLEQWCFMMLEYYYCRNVMWSYGPAKTTEMIVAMKSQVMRKSDEMRKKGQLRMPARFTEVLNVVTGLGFATDPKYVEIESFLQQIIKDEKIDMKLPLDWIAMAPPVVKPKAEVKENKADKGEGAVETLANETLNLGVGSVASNGPDQPEKKIDPALKRKQLEEAMVKAYKNAGITVTLAEAKDMLDNNDLPKVKKPRRKKRSRRDEESSVEEDSESSEDDYSDDEESRRRRRRKRRARKRRHERRTRDDSDKDHRKRPRSDAKKKRRKGRKRESRAAKATQQYRTSYPFKEKKELVLADLHHAAFESREGSARYMAIADVVDRIRNETMLKQMTDLLKKHTKNNDEAVIKALEELVKDIPKVVTKQMVKRAFDDIRTKTKEDEYYYDLEPELDGINDQALLDRMWIACQNWEDLGDKQTLKELTKIVDEKFRQDRRNRREKGREKRREKGRKKEGVKISVNPAEKDKDKEKEKEKEPKKGANEEKTPEVIEAKDKKRDSPAKPPEENKPKQDEKKKDEKVEKKDGEGKKTPDKEVVGAKENSPIKPVENNKPKEDEKKKDEKMEKKDGEGKKKDEKVEKKDGEGKKKDEKMEKDGEGKKKDEKVEKKDEEVKKKDENMEKKDGVKKTPEKEKASPARASPAQTTAKTADNGKKEAVDNKKK